MSHPRWGLKKKALGGAMETPGILELTAEGTREVVGATGSDAGRFDATVGGSGESDTNQQAGPFRW